MNRSRAAAWILGILLVALHVDFWRPATVEIRAGWIPDELLYRLVWMALAWAYLLFFCSRIWNEKEP